MNLTQMREYEWEEKILNLYDTYSKVTKWMTVQRLMNILLYYNPGSLFNYLCSSSSCRFILNVIYIFRSSVHT